MATTSIRNRSIRLHLADGMAGETSLPSRYFAHANDQDIGDDVEGRRSLAVLVTLLASALGVATIFAIWSAL